MNDVCHLKSFDTALLRTQQLIRSRQGWGLILGDAGSGKTALAHSLRRCLSRDDSFIFHSIASPEFKSEFQFLLHLVKLFKVVPHFKSTLDFKEALKTSLLESSIAQHKTVVLLIDQAHLLSLNNLEVLRTLVHYKKGGIKLLQLVTLAQIDILSRIKRIPHLSEGIALKYTLNPLDERETREMIEFRLTRAGSNIQRSHLTDEAFGFAYQYTKGLPGSITEFCEVAAKAIAHHRADTVDARMLGTFFPGMHEA